VSAKKETFGKTVGVVIAVCLVCSIVVSSAAVGLRSLQQANVRVDKQTNILEAAGLLGEHEGTVDEIFAQYVEEKFVDLATGEYVSREAGYDMYKAARDPEQSIKPVPDTAGIIRRPNVVSVYIIKDANGELNRLVLPVHGSGLWDVMYGFLALDSDGNTTRNMVYYQHKETPGLGGEVVNPRWKALWDGKKLYKDGDVAIRVKKNPGNDPYAVDALSGATLTSNGVQNTLSYWLGDEGFGPFLTKQPWKS
jgi:Na+-transporting NADH:ubiquinone oxidoreductase subunit C